MLITSGGAPDEPVPSDGRDPSLAGPSPTEDAGEGPGAPACVVSPDGTPWRLVFADEFDGPALDPDVWYLYDSEGNAGHGLRRPAAITVEDGRLGQGVHHR